MNRTISKMDIEIYFLSQGDGGQAGHDPVPALPEDSPDDLLLLPNIQLHRLRWCPHHQQGELLLR